MKRYGVYVWIKGQKHERFYNPDETSLLNMIYWLHSTKGVSHVKIVETYRKKEKVTYYTGSMVYISQEQFNVLQRKHQIQYLLGVDKK